MVGDYTKNGPTGVSTNNKVVKGCWVHHNRMRKNYPKKTHRESLIVNLRKEKEEEKILPSQPKTSQLCRFSLFRPK